MQQCQNLYPAPRGLEAQNAYGQCVAACNNSNNGGDPAPVSCSAAPTVSISVTPTMIWPPNKKLVAVTVSGTIAQDAGCTLQSASWTLTDEYGANQAGPLSVSNGSFSVTVYVQAWREGQDKDGRSYSFSASATNQIGTGNSNTAVATVPHDQRP